MNLVRFAQRFTHKNIGYLPNQFSIDISRGMPVEAKIVVVITILRIYLYSLFFIKIGLVDDSRSHTALKPVNTFFFQMSENAACKFLIIKTF